MEKNSRTRKYWLILLSLILVSIFLLAHRPDQLESFSPISVNWGAENVRPSTWNDLDDHPVRTLQATSEDQSIRLPENIQWGRQDIYCLTSPPFFSAFLDAGIDKNNNIEIIHSEEYYFDSTIPTVKNLFYGNNSWHSIIIDESYGIGKNSSLALDSDGKAHAVYVEPETHSIKYGYKDATGWHLQSIFQGNEEVSDTTITLDSNNRPHIAFHYQRTLFYGTVIGNAWNFWFFSNTNDISRDVKINILSTDEPFITYLRMTGFTMLFKENGKWYGEKLSIGGSNVYFKQMDAVLDEYDYPYLAMSTRNEISLVVPGDEGWISIPLHNCEYCGEVLSIELNKQNLPYILYTGHNDWSSRVSYIEANQMVHEVIHSNTGHSYRENKLLFDSNNKPHVIQPFKNCIYEHVKQEVIEKLIASATTPTELGMPTYFYASVTSGDDVQFEWVMADGTRLTSPNTSYVLNQLGSRLNTVTAKNLVSSLMEVVFVEVIDAKIRSLSIGGNTPKAVSEPIELTAHHSTGTNVSYEWELGEGITKTGKTITTTYSIPGVYTVTLRAKNSTSTAEKTAELIVQEPITGLELSHTPQLTTGITTAFSATATTGTDITYKWRFGDTTWANGQYQSHTLDCTGKYTITVTAENLVSKETDHINYWTPNIISPEGGCTILAEDVRLELPPGFVSETVTATYQTLPPDHYGLLVPVVHPFHVTISTVPTVTGYFTQPYTLTVGFTPEQLGSLSQAVLGIYTPENDQWVKFEPFVFDMAMNRITITPFAFEIWALMSNYRIYSPVLIK